MFDNINFVIEFFSLKQFPSNYKNYVLIDFEITLQAYERAYEAYKCFKSSNNSHHF